MNNKSHKLEIIIPLLTILLDSVLILISYIISFEIRFNTSLQNIFPVTKGYPELEWYFYFGLITLPVWILTFHSNKMYRLNRSVFVFDEFFVIVRCITISVIFSIGIIFFFRDFPYSRLVFVLIWFVSIILITIGRYFILKLEKTLYNKQIGIKNVAVLGTNEMAEKIYTNFSRDKFTGFNVVGYFAKQKVENNNKIYLGNYESIPEVIKSRGIEKILISLSSSEHDDLFTLLRACEGINVEFMLAPDFIDLITSKIKINEVNGIPFMKIKSLPLNAWNNVLKRTFDVITSLLLLFVFSPLFIIISILIKLTSKGPLFYKQERVGLDGNKFMMFKFRSMRVDAEKTGPQFASEEDDRVTSIGKFIRKYSLDELPQFLNVLKGDMSIVGPRPEREFFINKMKHHIKRYLERHRVKCGVTGWAQVNGLRGSGTSMQSRIDYDIYYIENWSLAFDIKIIVKTLKEVLFSKEAF
ncbi:MAG: undecaprenyl-phosphate glucose phosphotransferase [Bacteroidetes bacterium]|nr:undecaprenyl-phosphate glucose phosphotransferase [Bacteroidota bacterium]